MSKRHRSIKVKLWVLVQWLLVRLLHPWSVVLCSSTELTELPADLEGVSTPTWEQVTLCSAILIIVMSTLRGFKYTLQGTL